MLNLFKKIKPQRIILGLEMLSESECDNFIKLVKSDLISRGVEISGIEDNYLIAKLDGNDLNIGLVNLAQKCKLITQSEWPSAIKEHFAATILSKDDKEELQKNITDFNKIKDLLAIQLYSDCCFGAENKLKEFKNEMITRSNIPFVNNTLVFDLPAAIRSVAKSEIKTWNKTKDELFDIALNNTFDKVDPEIAEEQMLGGKVVFITSDNPLTAALVLNLKRFNQCIGTYGSLVAIPTRELIMCYPINDVGVIEAIPNFISFAHELYLEDPRSLSPELYWYQDDKFTHLPSKIENETLDFAPPQNFTDVLEKLTELNEK